MKLTIETQAPLFQRLTRKKERAFLERELSQLLCAQAVIVAMQAGGREWNLRKSTTIELDVAPDEMYEGATCSITGE